MSAPSRYTITETIHTSEHSVVHLGRRASDQEPVIIKQLAGEHPSLEAIVKLKYEYAIQSSERHRLCPGSDGRGSPAGRRRA